MFFQSEISKIQQNDKTSFDALIVNDDNKTQVNQELNITNDDKIQEVVEIKDESWKKLQSNDILKQAIDETNKNQFDDAKEKFEYLISIHYKPARSTFWLGEIQYKQQDYAGALGFYKKSSAISTKGDYVPKLLYHTAISLDKVGDTKSANKFYKALKTAYPDSPEAKASPDRK